MKVLFDPIPTTEINKCASMVKFYNLALDLLQDEDVFIYWLIPDDTGWLTVDAIQWLPKSDRIKYIKVKTDRDRYKEYRRITYARERVFSYLGDFWDWDVCVTNRTSMVPTIKALSHHHANPYKWAKPIIIIEDFPLMSFKLVAAVQSTREQDLYTILGYQTATKTLISAYWEKDIICDIARAYLSPSELALLKDRIVECHPYQMSNLFELKSKEFVIDQQNGGPFTIVFAGRLSSEHKFDKIFSIMESNWVLKSRERKVNLEICTQSISGGAGVQVPPFVHVNYFSRDKFWNFMRSKASVGLFFSGDEDYSLSLIEPIILGVPYAVYRARWAEASLGKDYPFFFNTEMEAYSIVRAFYDDYASNYVKFAKWQKEHFRKLIKSRDEVTVPIMVREVISDLREKFKSVSIPTDKDATSNILFRHLTNKPQSVRQLVEAEARYNPMPLLEDKAKDSNHMGYKCSFSSNRYVWKLQLIARGVRESLDTGTFYLP